MNLFQIVSLGIIQGLTEFLPVSSSGHLVLLQNLFGLKEPELLFDVSVHVGTLVAVLLVFRHEILMILKSLVRLPALRRNAGTWRALYAENPEIRMTVLIVAGSVPTALLGFFFKDWVDTIFGSVGIVGVMLLVTGVLLWLTRRCAELGRPLLRVRVIDGLVIGLIQGLAIIPGISRSGSTIATALFLGVERETAGRFSFLLSIPAIIGALVLSLDSGSASATIGAGGMLLGAVVAALVGYGALKLLLHLVKKGAMYRFAPYCWLIGLVALIAG